MTISGFRSLAFRFAFPTLATVVCAVGLVVASAGSGLVPRSREGVPRAAGGLLDLRGWDFARGGSVPLVGEWDFFPGRLLYGEEARRAPREGGRKVPDLWKGGDAGGISGRGSGTYRLRVLLPPSLFDPAVRYTTVSTSFELDAQGAPVASAGRPSDDAMSHLAAYRPGVARLPSSGELELVVRVSNYEYRAGGMWRPFVLGPASALERASWVRQTILCAESAALGALALSYLFFFLNRRRERTYLYFALLLLSISLRALVTGEYVLVRMFPRLGFDALIRLEYVSVFFPTPLAALFFSSLFPLELSRKGVAAIVAPFFVLSLLLPAAPLRLLTRSVLAVYPLMALAMLALGAFVFVPAVARRREDSVLEFVGASLLMALGVNDALFASFKVQTGNFFPFGLLVFVGIQSHVLSRRFSAALESAVELSAEKDSLIKEVHHRVKNSLQIISSAIALQSHRAEDPAVLRALEATRARVRAISLVHERLYALDAPGFLDLGDYVRDLARQLEAGFRCDEGGDELVVEAEAVPASQGLCVDVGLALAELLSNAYRHAARRGEDSNAVRVSVSLRGEGDVVLLRVADDGPGFPEGFSPDSSRGLGFRMISSLARRRGWSLTIGDGPGAVVELRIPRLAGDGGSIAGQAKERG